MANLTIRNLDPRMKERLRVRAARHGVSLAEEARRILNLAVAAEHLGAEGEGTAIRAIFEPLGGVELEFDPREPMRAPPRPGGTTR